MASPTKRTSATPSKRANALATAAPPMPKAATPDTVAINVPLPYELHRQLRMTAFMEGQPLKDAVIQAIEGWLAAHPHA